jgi:UDP-N-acetylglucosamine/UDP-N-acetylgalactosamine diphosphorylase
MIFDMQPHLQFGLETLDAAAQARFLNTLSKYGPETLQAQRALIGAVQSLEEYQPLETVACAGNDGWNLIAEGKVGCVVLAGGQGTRLGHDAPKGTMSVGPLTSKSLFQRLAERVVHAGNKAGRALPLAIMTSPQNDAATQHYFQEHAHFGLQDLSFFSQSTLPLLDEQGNWFLEAPGVLAEGPDGNGNALLRF